MSEKNAYIWPQLELEATHYTLEQIHDAQLELPHIALAGRSNVGKSSIINALARRKQLAKISSTPGKTRSVNFYKVIPDNFYLTDLPGYGYAQRSKTERELWAKLIQKYLLQTRNLCAVVILLDCRLSPQEVDIAMARFALDNKIPVFPILTKADKSSQLERALRQREWEVFIPELALPVSARSGLGMVELWQKIREIASTYVLEEPESEGDDFDASNNTSVSKDFDNSFDNSFNDGFDNETDTGIYNGADNEIGDEIDDVFDETFDDQCSCEDSLEDDQAEEGQEPFNPEANLEKKNKKPRWRTLESKKPVKNRCKRTPKGKKKNKNYE